jgi:hypothetical protein
VGDLAGGSVIPSLLVLVGLVQTLPLVGAAGGAALRRLYGEVPQEGPTALLLRHRAVLLGLVGLLLLAAAAWPELRWLAVGMGLASKLSYVALVGGTGERSPELRRIAWIDLGTSLLLGLVAALLLTG